MSAVRKKISKILLSLAVIACVSAIIAWWFVAGHSFLDLWLTPDQQGRTYFEKNDYKAAAERFQNPLWKGIAYYRSKNYDAAIDQFARVDTAEAAFDLGDAYVHSGGLEQAAACFEEVLRRRPDDGAAKENHDLVQSLIKKKRAREKEEEPPEGQEPIFDPDEIKVDEKGKKGKKGEIEQADLSAEEVQQVWMRRLQTTPSDFLRLKFAAQAEETQMSRPTGERRGGKP